MKAENESAPDRLRAELAGQKKWMFALVFGAVGTGVIRGFPSPADPCPTPTCKQITAQGARCVRDVRRQIISQCQEAGFGFRIVSAGRADDRFLV